MTPSSVQVPSPNSLFSYEVISRLVCSEILAFMIPWQHRSDRIQGMLVKTAPLTACFELAHHWVVYSMTKRGLLSFRDHFRLCLKESAEWRCPAGKLNCSIPNFYDNSPAPGWLRQLCEPGAEQPAGRSGFFGCGIIESVLKRGCQVRGHELSKRKACMRTTGEKSISTCD